ncbi:hypothetical protein PIB30_030684 [Stylosanthes scabra]|uniref:CBF1-interacting co-repressor CIR N-terminal domain-containing protein n=1 Tax=Stylosanthes scabra TaxID=79078 RepID=A0ABU6SBT6_9FABA|nr:hypothetical protein [Stylosanthes scabra]
MGGHGGLNILPQKRWNVYNYDNREKVRRDEEQAARDEQIKRDEIRKREAEFRLERLRTAKGLAPLVKATAEEEKKEVEEEEEPESKNSGDTGHINLFEGIKIFDPVRGSEKRKELLGEREEWNKKEKRLNKELGKSTGVAVGPEDEKYRLGFGVAGKGVKMPWYLEKRNGNDERDDSDGEVKNENKKKKSGRKTLEELREERLKREKREKERERALTGENRCRSSDRACGGDRDVYGNRKFNSK